MFKWLKNRAVLTSLLVLVLATGVFIIYKSRLQVAAIPNPLSSGGPTLKFTAYSYNSSAQKDYFDGPVTIINPPNEEHGSIKVKANTPGVLKFRWIVLNPPKDKDFECMAFDGTKSWKHYGSPDYGSLGTSGSRVISEGLSETVGFKIYCDGSQNIYLGAVIYADTGTPTPTPTPEDIL